MGSVKIGLPVSQHLPPAEGGACDGLTEAVGLPGGRTTALVTAILFCNELPTALPNEDTLPALRTGADAGDGEVDDSEDVAVTGHCKLGDPLKENCDMLCRPTRAVNCQTPLGQRHSLHFAVTVTVEKSLSHTENLGRRMGNALEQPTFQLGTRARWYLRW